MLNADGLRKAYQSGALSRTELWAALKALNNSLLAYKPLLQNTDICKLGVSVGGLQVILHNGLVFTLDPEDVRQPPNIILAHGEYERGEHRVLSKLWANAGVFFDIGANIGWYSLHAARDNPACRIFGFEPVPETFAALNRNIAANELEHRIRVFNFGLSDQAGEQTMFRPSFSGSPAASMRELHPQEGSDSFLCRFVTLDEFFAQTGEKTLDLIKCDVEGAELFVLRGGIQTIRQSKPYIFIEILRKWSRAFGYEPNEIFAVLLDMGYGAYAVGHNSVQPISGITEETTETNFVFAHPERPSLEQLSSELHD